MPRSKYHTDDTYQPIIESKHLKLVPLSELHPEQPLSSLLADKSEIKRCKCGYNTRWRKQTHERSLLDKISHEIYPYAFMSMNAYNKPLQVSIPGWQRKYRVINKYHGFSADIYLSDDENKVVIAFRGTDSYMDWISGNFKICCSKDVKNSQYEDANDLFGWVLDHYKNKKITATGHSLGGGLALHISTRNHGVDAFVFNTSPRVFMAGIAENRVVIADETGDVLEFLRMISKVLKKIPHEKYQYNFTGGNAIKEHGIKNFARCMYASLFSVESGYHDICKKNT